MNEIFEDIKSELEEAILSEDTNTIEYIRSQKLIKRLHDKIIFDTEQEIKKYPYVFSRVSPSSADESKRILEENYKVNIPKKMLLNSSRTEIVNHIYENTSIPRKTKAAIKEELKRLFNEIRVYGQMKSKDQDIVVFPKQGYVLEETIDRFSMIEAKDPYGRNYTEKILSINVRSQNSSVDKNFDTLYERTIAEAVNLHMRCPDMVLGEVYYLNLAEYDSKSFKMNEIKHSKLSEDIVLKYVKGFASLNKREENPKINNPQHSVYRAEAYERVALILVNFETSPIKIYKTTEELINDGFLSERYRNQRLIEDLTYDNFIKDLIDEYRRRFVNR